MAVRGVAVYALVDWMPTAFELVDAPAPAPYYRLSLRDDRRAYMTLLVVPSRHLVRVWQPTQYPYAPGLSTPYWRALTPRGAAVLGKVTARLRPFAAPRSWRF